MRRQFRAPRAISDLPLVALCVVLVSLSTIPLYARPTDQANASSQEFQRRLEAYLDLRRMLLQQLKPILPTTSAMELAARQTQLAQALRTARMQAKPGDLLSADAAALIRAAIVEDFRARPRRRARLKRHGRPRSRRCRRHPSRPCRTTRTRSSSW